MSVTFQTEKMSRLLHELLGREVTIKNGPAVTAKDAVFTASYVGDSDDLLALCLCDLELVLDCGAALCLIPVYEVTKSLKAKQLDPALSENFKEVLNICAQLFGTGSAQRVRLASVYRTGDDVPEPVKKFMADSKVRRDLQLAISGYGSGKMTVFC